jgi:hypothetical protein
MRDRAGVPASAIERKAVKRFPRIWLVSGLARQTGLLQRPTEARMKQHSQSPIGGDAC